MKSYFGAMKENGRAEEGELSGREVTVAQLVDGGGGGGRLE
jgi:hypothetical protein